MKECFGNLSYELGYGNCDGINCDYLATCLTEQKARKNSVIIDEEWDTIQVTILPIPAWELEGVVFISSENNGKPDGRNSGNSEENL